MYDDDDDDCPFTDDDCLMGDAQSNVDDDGCPFREDTNFDDDDSPFRDSEFDDDDDDPPGIYYYPPGMNDYPPGIDDSPPGIYPPGMDDSQFNVVDDLLAFHESRLTQPHPSTLSGDRELLDVSRFSQMTARPSYFPSFERPAPSGVSPDIIARLTPAELAHNPEFLLLHNRFERLQSTVAKLELYLNQRRIDAENEIRARAQSRVTEVRERVLEWRSEVHA